MYTNQEQLEIAISRLNDLELLVKDLYDTNKTSFEGNKHLSKRFDAFFRLLSTTKERLVHPVLSLAFIGTTSAGKSTIVNALSGRKVAPMEKLETSAGILRLKPSTQVAIDVTKTPKCKWEVGRYTDVTDEAIYKRIQNIYAEYKKFEKITQAPEITVTGPLFMNNNRDLLSLPDNLSLEFIDLPGLKTIKDNNNLKVIQKALSKSLCVIAIDFNDVDDSRIQRLLDEVRDIVKISGNPDSLLFLLNKVDNIQKDDVPLSERIMTFQRQISNGLQLEDGANIKLIPFVGILLYRLQMSVVVNEHQKVVSYDNEGLKDLFEYCSNSFRRTLLTKEELTLKKNIEDKVYDEEDIPLEDLSKFYQLCLKLSHANELFIELNRRVETSFKDIIIRPALSELFANLDLLVSDITTYIHINQKTSAIDLISERIGVQRMRLFLLGSSREEDYVALINEISEISNAIEAIDNSGDEDYVMIVRRMKRDLEKLSASIEERALGFIDLQIQDISNSVSEIAGKLRDIQEPEEVSKYLNSIRDINRAVGVYNGISDIPAQIKRRLEAEVLVPFRSSIEQKKSKGEFVEELSKTNPTIYGESLSSNYGELFELFYTQFLSFTKKEFTYELRTESLKGEDWVRQTMRVYHNLDVRMRDVLSKKTNFYFQIDTSEFVRVLNVYLKQELDSILTELKKQLPCTDSDFSLMIDNLMKVQKNEIELPDTLFAFTTPQGSSHITKNEYLGSYLDHYETHSCSADEAVYKDKWGDVYYYKYDNAKGVYNRWDNGIGRSMPAFWLIISDWIITSVNAYMENIKKSSSVVAEMTLSFLVERLNTIQEENDINMAKFGVLEEKLNCIQLVEGNFFSEETVIN